jgi:hypothetical protein
MKEIQRHFYHECQNRAEPGRMAACGFVKRTPPSFDESQETCPDCLAITRTTSGTNCPACGELVL